MSAERCPAAAAASTGTASGVKAPVAVPCPAARVLATTTSATPRKMPSIRILVMCATPKTDQSKCFRYMILAAPMETRAPAGMRIPTGSVGTAMNKPVISASGATDIFQFLETNTTPRAPAAGWRKPA